jgi:hypothetical protein
MQTNYLDPTSFKVAVSRLPNVEFFTRRTIIPGVTMSPVARPSPNSNLYETADRLEYAELDLSFVVDENMANYQEILYWMESLGKSETTDQFARLEKTDEGIVSDVTIIVENSNKNPNMLFTFTDCFPTILSPLSLDITQQDIVYPEATVTMRHNGFKLTQVS